MDEIQIDLTNEATETFDKWFVWLQIFLVENGHMTMDAVKSLSPSAWREYWRDGYTFEEAWYEDASYGAVA